jgi:hypothetical protein
MKPYYRPAYPFCASAEHLGFERSTPQHCVKEPRTVGTVKPSR